MSQAITHAVHAAEVADRREASGRGVLVALSLSMLLSSLGTSIANVALPTLALAFGASFQHVQWIVLAYLLAVTTLTVGAGGLGDLAGRRRLLLSGIALFSAASIACGVAPALPLLIAARAVQGTGAAIMMALTLAFVSEVVPKGRTGSAMGLLGTMSAIGTALGPSLGGALIAMFGWRALFLMQAPLGLAALLLVVSYLPRERQHARSGQTPFDVAGTLVLASALAAYALAVTFGRGRFGAANVGLLAAAAFGLALFAMVQRRVAAPLVDLRMLRNAPLTSSLVMSAIVSSVVMSILVVGPFYLGRALLLDASMTGFVLSAGPLAAAITGVPAGRLSDRFGTRRIAITGLAGIAAGSVALSLLPPSGVAAFVVPMVVITASYALFQAANNTAVMSGAGADRGVISGMLNLSRNIGLMTGASVMGAIFARAAGTLDASLAAPAAVALGLQATFGVAAVLTVVSIAIALRA